ncbi:MAG: prephenate dehydratase [Rhodobiaceae bacterium]|nr:prephenate dehydratase [Rhodobiaceae bacterium]
MSNASSKIVFQGEPGANSHIACQEVFPEYEAVPCATFEDAFAEVAEGRAALAMIPIENSVAGRVADIHYLMPTSGLSIIGEYFLPIHHQLVGVRGATLEGLTHIRSHVMALGQCRKLIRKRGVTAVIAADTAGSAREIAALGDATQGALASSLAAEIYGLDILASDVEDEDHNTTRFVILSREPRWVDAGGSGTITTFVFRVRNVPAALYKAMGGFATNGVNMTKLESYQLEGQFFATQFYADIEGHPHDPAVARALDELEYYTREFKILGVYKAASFRESIRETAVEEPSLRHPE